MNEPDQQLAAAPAAAAAQAAGAAIASRVRGLRIISLAAVLAVLGLCAIIVSAINGSRFVGDPSNAASLAMGIAAAVAILCYVIIGFAATARLSS